MKGKLIVRWDNAPHHKELITSHIINTLPTWKNPIQLIWKMCYMR
ncbi:MAG: toxin-antitoxin system TumE family protein [Promethearchaeota archaeon]